MADQTGVSETLARIQEIIEAKRLLMPPRKDDKSELRESIKRLALRKSEFAVQPGNWSGGQLAAKAESDRVEMEMRGHEYFAKAGVPKLHRDRLRSLSTDGRYAAWAAQWHALAARVDDPDGCLVAMAGTRGAGKTQLGVCAIDRICRRGCTAMYVEAPFLFMQIRDSFRDSGGEAKCYRRFTAPQLLFIDQAEERKHSEAEDRMLFNIVNKRYAECRHTIIASNESLAALHESLGASIVSWINEAGEFIECCWEDLRCASLTQ